MNSHDTGVRANPFWSRSSASRYRLPFPVAQKLVTIASMRRP